MKIRKLTTHDKEYVIELRRHFHMYPETAWNEKSTSQKIKEELTHLEIPFSPIAETGVIATIKGKRPGKTIALRADMDALAVSEKSGVSFQSKNKGVSHACGHDGHMAMLLGAARILNELKSDIKGTVKLIFQPAEEVLTGAVKVIEASGLRGVDSIFGIHINGLIPMGMVTAGTGPILSSADFFNIAIKGQGGHGGMPDQGVDAIVAASAVVMNLQSIASREISPVEPVVVTVGVLHAGTRNNVLAGEAKLEGTTRCYNDAVRKKLPEAIKRIVQRTAGAYRAKATVEYISGAPPTVNDEQCAKRVRATIEKTLGRKAFIQIPPMTGAEDFAYYQRNVPGVFIFLGARSEEEGTSYPQHHEKFRIDENALEIGTMLNVQYALDYLNEK